MSERTHAQQFEDLLEMFPQEELHPDLAEYLSTSDNGWLCLRHPLVYSIMHNDALNGRMNAQYEQKKLLVAEAFAKRQWHSYVFFHERPYRLDALLDVLPHLRDDKYGYMLRRVWMDSENIPQCQEQWDLMLRKINGDQMMDPDEREALRAMPDEFQVWQGHTTDRDDGWSWTLNRDTAVWFANRFASLEHSTAALSTAWVRRDDVLAYLTGRNEEEILVDPNKVKRKAEAL